VNNRRKLVVALGAGTLVAPFCSFAQQQSGKVVRIGFLGMASAAGTATRLEAFRQGMRELGYFEGKNLVIDVRYAEGKYDRLPDLASELVRLKVDVIVTHATGIYAAKVATTAIPIVIGAVGDAVATGIVASLAKPGGNITGSTFFGPEITAKRLELIRELLPRAKRIALLINPDYINAGLEPTRQAIAVAAKSLKMDVREFGVRSPNEFESTFAAMSREHFDAVAVFDEPMLIANAAAAASLAIKHRMPSIGTVEFADAGGLLAYGAQIPAMFRRAAYFVDKILKGAKPGDIPIERTTVFEFVINLKTAKSLGIKIPPTLMQRPDRLIE
jgi:putative ABC transport system substrate-binding protein